MKNKILINLLITCIFFVYVPFSSFAEDLPTTYWTDEGIVATSFAGGSGTKDDPYQISTGGQLALIAKMTNENEDSWHYYKQTADIDFGEHLWTPIGIRYSNEAYFEGNFDGGNYAIFNLTIDASQKSNIGLFGYAFGGAHLSNINIMNCFIIGNDAVGALVGCADDVFIKNCYSSGNVQGVGDAVGGLIGSSKHTDVNSCRSTCSVTGKVGVGGLVGEISKRFSSVRNSNTTGNVTGENYIGGLIGSFDSDDSSGIENCYATGIVTGTGDNIGGFIGSYITDGSVFMSNCYATGNVIGNNNVGGFAGAHHNTKQWTVFDGEGFPEVTTFDSYATGNVIGNNNVGGFAGHHKGRMENGYSSGTVTGSGNNIGGFSGNPDGFIKESKYYDDNGSARYTEKAYSGLENCSYNIDKNPNFEPLEGLTGKIEEEMKTSSFALSLGEGWQQDFTPNINGGYPIFTWQQPLTEEPIEVTLNGAPLTFDVDPIMENDRVLVPMRAIFESLGAEVTWEDSTKTVTATTETAEISLQIGTPQIIVNGETIPLDVAPVLVNDRTLVPVRAVSEGLGADVQWDEAAKTVVITT